MDSGELSVYRGCTPIVDARYRVAEDDSLADVVVDALADAAGVDPLDLPPLYEFVDSDTLETFIDDTEGGDDGAAILCFQVDSWNVFVRADGWIRVCDATKSIGPEPVFETGSA